jgi:hypothetical protein
VKPHGKAPLIPSAHPEGDPARGTCRGECVRDGHGLWDGTIDLERMRAWWTRWPSANVGIRTGERFDVLDLDGAKGIASMEAFAAEHQFSLDRVPFVETPGGGRHYYFEPTGLGNADPKLESVDWRGRGGFVVAGLSIHPNGRPYAEIPAGADRPPFVPAALRELLQPPKPEPAPARPTFRPASTNTRYARAALEGTQARILGATLGKRNSVAFREACALFGLVAGGVVDEAEATAMLGDAMRTVGLGAREIAGTIASARRRGMARPRGLPAAPSAVRLPAPGAVLREDSFTAWASGKPQVAPWGHTPSATPATFPTARLREIYRTLEFGSFIDARGRRVREGVSHAALARHYSVSEETIKREPRTLERLGYLARERIPARRIPDGRLVGATNRYALLLDPRGVREATIESLTVGSRAQSNTDVAPWGHDPSVTPQNHVQPYTSVHPEVGRVSHPVDGRASTPEVEPEPWPTDEAGNLEPIHLRVPETGWLDNDPVTEILATLRSGLGEVRVLGAVRHDDADTAAELETINAGSAPLPPGWNWRARWRVDPVGACVRCGSEANTPGPDGRPWHALCWGAAGTPPPPATYGAATRLQPRHLDLAGSLEDFHRAVDHLDRDTCIDRTCRPASHAAATPGAGARTANSGRPTAR